MSRVFRALAGATLAIPLLLAGAILAANTQPGRDGLARLVAAAVPGLVIEGLSGALPSQIGARRITLADADGVWLAVEGLDVRIDWPALLRRTLRIERLTATSALVHRLPAGSADAPATDAGVIPSLPSTPLPLELDELRVDALVLDAAVMGVAARLALDASGGLGGGIAKVVVALRRLDAPGQAGLTLDWNPAADHLAAALTLDEPAGGLVATLLGRPDAATHLALSLDGPIDAAPFRVQARLGDSDRADADGTIGLAPDGTATLRLAATATAPGLLPPALAELSLTAGMRRAPDGGLVVTAATAKAPAAHVWLSGTLAASGAVSAAWRAEARPGAAALLPAETGFAAAVAEGHLSGTLDAPILDGSLRVTDPRSGVAVLDPLLGASATLTLRAGLTQATGTFEAAAIQARIAATWQAVLAGRIEVTLPDLTALGSGLAGSARATGTLAGGIEDGRVVFDGSGEDLASGETWLGSPTLSGSVRLAAGRPVEVTAEGRASLGSLPIGLRVQAAPEGTRIRITTARLTAGEAILDATGLIDPVTLLAEGSASLAIPDLATLLPGAPPGRVAARLRASVIEAVQHLDLEAEAALRGGTTASASARGPWDGLALTAQAAGAGLRGSLRGTARPRDRLLDVTALEVLGADTPPLRLLRPARLRLADDGPTIEGLALGVGTGRIEAAGALRGRIEATLRAVPIDVTGALTGRLDGTVTLQAAERARFQLAATAIASPLAPGLPPGSVRVEGEATAAGASLRGTAEAGVAGRFDLTARLGGYGGGAPLEGTLRGSLDAARLAAPFIAGGADRVSGRIALDMRLGGTLADPLPEGTAILSAGSWQNAALGGAVTDVAGRLRFAGTSLRIEALTARTAGGGSLALDGSLEPLADGVPAALRLVARNARPINGPFGTGEFDADLALDGPLLGAASLTGRVLVKRADLRVPETLPASVPRLSGVRARGTRPSGAAPLPQPRASGRGGPAWALAVQLDAPQRILVVGRGLDVELGGGLALRGTLGAPQADGALTLRRGTVALPTRRLAFQRGTLTFLGDPIPELNLVAGADSGGYSVAIEVTGPATAPRIAITSSPTLPPEEAMALLLFGRSGQRLSAGEAVQAAQALAQLSGLPAFADGGLLGRLGRSLGLDRLGVGTSASGAAGVDAGRYIAPGLYLGIRPGTDGSLPGVAAQWDLTPRLRLEAETSRGAGGERVGMGYELEY